MKKHNLHTHTTFSDGKNSPINLIEMAKKENIEVLGISDHGFTSKTNSLNERNLNDYIESIRKIKEQNTGILLKIGLEIDFGREYGSDLSDLPFGLLNQLDYVLF